MDQTVGSAQRGVTNGEPDRPAEIVWTANGGLISPYHAPFSIRPRPVGEGLYLLRESGTVESGCLAAMAWAFLAAAVGLAVLAMVPAMRPLSPKHVAGIGLSIILTPVLLYRSKRARLPTREILCDVARNTTMVRTVTGPQRRAHKVPYKPSACAIRVHPVRLTSRTPQLGAHLDGFAAVAVLGDESIAIACSRNRAKIEEYLAGLPEPMRRAVVGGEGPLIRGDALLGGVIGG